MPLQQTTKMAKILNIPLFFLTLALALSFTPSLLPHNVNATSYDFSTNVLDITASLNQAHQALSFNPKTLQQETKPATPTSSPSSFSLPLHPRASLLNDHHNDYQNLLLSRLQRDSARVNLIINKFKLQFNNSDLYPTNMGLRPEGLSAPITPSVAQIDGEYFTRIGVGLPAQQFYMTPDLVSDENWLQCKPCSNCYQQSDPIFDPSKSYSYAPLTCEAQQCQELKKTSCNNNTCQYKIPLGDVILSEGDFMIETVSFGLTGSVNRVAMGCGHNNQGDYVKSAGILALGGGPLSLTSQIKVSSFSYCLVDHNNLSKSSTLEFNSSRPDDSVTAQLLKNPKAQNLYYVGFTGVSVGGQNVPVPESTFKPNSMGLGGMLVDAEIAVTRLQVQAYNSVRDVFMSFTRRLKRVRSPVELFDTCYDFSGLRMVLVPAISFQANDGKLWTMPPLNYLIPMDKNGTYCLALAPFDHSISILGTLQQGTRVTFDLANSIIGFSPYKC